MLLARTWRTAVPYHAARIGGGQTTTRFDIRQARHESTRRSGTVSLYIKGQQNSGESLRKQLAQRTFGEMSNQSVQLEMDISSGKTSAVSVLQSTTAGDSVDLDTIRACLSGEWRRVSKILRAERPKALESESTGLGRIVLSRLWQDEALWVPLICRDLGIRDRLCYFAINDGLQSLLVDWIGAYAATADAQSKALTDRSHAWRGSLFRGTVSALLMLQPARTADTALQCFFEVEEQRQASISAIDSILKAPISKLNTWPATSRILIEILNGRSLKTNPALYDKFVTFYQSYQYDRDILRHFRLSAILLYHPTRPSATETLEFMRTHISHANDGELYNFRDSFLSVMDDIGLRKYFTRISTVSSSDDAKWTWDQYKRLLRLQNSHTEAREATLRPLGTDVRETCHRKIRT